MELKAILEAILFTSQKPLSVRELREVLSGTADKSEDFFIISLKKTKDETIEQALAELELDHKTADRSFRLVCVAGAWQFVSQPQHAPWLKTLLGEKNRPARLSQPGLETLTIVAYRQPITRAEIEQIRGVAVDGVMQTLLERGLVENAGRAEVIGRPMTYKTTSEFLEYFGLKSLEELPSADELRRIPVTKPETLFTVEPVAPSSETPVEQSPTTIAESTFTNDPPEAEETISNPQENQEPNSP